MLRKIRGINMQVNFNTYSTMPFMAKFSNDPETKRYLKRYAQNHDVQTKIMIDLLKASKTDDVISIEKDGIGEYSRVMIINRAANGEKKAHVMCHIKYLYDSVLKIRLSDNTRVADTMKKISKMPNARKREEMEIALSHKYHTSAKLAKYDKAIMKTTQRIHELDDKINNLYNQKENASQEYIAKYIDANV